MRRLGPRARRHIGSRRTCGCELLRVAEDMCTGPDALVSSNEAGAAARQSAAPAVPALPGLLPVPGVPDHDGGAGPRRKTASADAGDPDAPARAPYPHVDLVCVAESALGAPDRDRAAARAPPRVPAERSVFPPRGETFATRAPGFANRRPVPAFPAFRTHAIDADPPLRADASWLDVGASEKPAAAAEENPPTNPKTDRDARANVCPHALSERFGRDARLESVDREESSLCPSPRPSNARRRSREGRVEPDSAAPEDATEGESPSRKRRVDRSAGPIGRPIDRPLGRSDETRARRSTDDAPSRAPPRVRDFVPLMDLLEGRPSRARVAAAPPLFANAARDSVLSGRRGDAAEEEEAAARGLVDGLIVDAVDGVFRGTAAAAETESSVPTASRRPLERCDCASVAPRISPPTPTRDTGLDPAAPAFAPKRRRAYPSVCRGEGSSARARREDAPRTAAGRAVAPPAFAEAHVVPAERRELWGGPSGTLPSAREVLRFVDAVAETQARVGVPPFG